MSGPTSRWGLGRVTGVVGTVAGVLLSASLGGCGLLHSTPPLEKAVDLLPADATALVFSDREAVAKRLDLDEISGRDATDEQVKEYLDTWAGVGWDGTHLASYLTVMKDAPFNDLDVRWEAWARWGGDRSAFVWRADDDLDLGALGRSLTEHGYRKDLVHGFARYRLESTKPDPSTGLVDGVYPAIMSDVLLDSDDHLVVGSQTPDALADIAAVVDGSASSLGDEPRDYDELIDRATDADHLEFAAMAAGAGICPAVTPYGASEPAAPTPAYAALGHPVARALVATSDPIATTNYLEFASSDDAAADASARTSLIASGRELRQDVSFDSLGTFTVSHDGDLVKVDAAWSAGPKDAVSAELTGGGPAACLPEG